MSARTTLQTIDGLGLPLTLTLEVLVDKQQFAPDAESDAAGVWPEAWSLFGVVWPSGLKLAQALLTEPLVATALEVGCGLALPSLVLSHRGARVLATDSHPRAGDFLARNAARNGVPAVPFTVAHWGRPVELGLFDLIVGSDVLYEATHPQLLAHFLARHVAPAGHVLLTDPDRGNRPRFMRALEALGFATQSVRADDADIDFKGHLIRAQRR